MPLRVQEAGPAGPTVVLLHGLGSRGEDWVLQVEALRDRDRTVPMRAKHALAAAIPGARLQLIPGSGHATPLDAS